LTGQEPWLEWLPVFYEKFGRIISKAFERTSWFVASAMALGCMFDKDDLSRSSPWDDPQFRIVI
jgi:hypothetical protein